ncbi:uncharacterized protein LOC118403102 isoform X1 [Branchiostoma floridae]|uniref:Uncharacterized protein LOC118403102 isoform X1 n=1 Tax=Branchiostoma floridae TaxID=7739 RepID=A0A9J7HD92_BRAFL|nr:uncharacterized protein LOC118403102 isoform X1 [Branchiostoma floridae]
MGREVSLSPPDISTPCMRQNTSSQLRYLWYTHERPCWILPCGFWCRNTSHNSKSGSVKREEYRMRCVFVNRCVGQISDLTEPLDIERTFTCEKQSHMNTLQTTALSTRVPSLVKQHLQDGESENHAMFIVYMYPVDPNLCEVPKSQIRFCRYNVACDLTSDWDSNPGLLIPGCREERDSDSRKRLQGKAEVGEIITAICQENTPLKVCERDRRGADETGSLWSLDVQFSSPVSLGPFS